jgi:hypothetical protein
MNSIEVIKNPTIYGPRWGALPTDSELDSNDPEDCCNHYFTDLCTKDCADPISDIDLISTVLDEIINKVVYSVDDQISGLDTIENVHYYAKKYGVIPVEWRDEFGVLTSLVFTSNSDETRKLWGTSLTINYDDSDDDEEYDEGDRDDYYNERMQYFH